MSTLDRDATRAWLLKQFGLPDLADEISDEEFDALEECVQPAPQQTIDRAALIELLSDSGRGADWIASTALGVLALLRPVDGVHLTRDEAALAASALRAHPAVVGLIQHPSAVGMRSLADRLEAAS